jgi:PH and SEC7 domain-containing protein
MNQSPPPVPPLPGDRASPVAPLASDTSPLPNPIRATSGISKPLPPLQTEASNNDDAGVSMNNPSLIVELAGSSHQSPTTEMTFRARDAMVQPLRVMGHGKRRSMSVGEVDFNKKPTNPTLAVVPPPVNALGKRSEESMGWDSTIRGILSNFNGELSQLDQDSGTANTLDLQVPSTSQRLRTQGAEPTTSTVPQPDTGRTASSPRLPSKPNPTIIAHAPDSDGMNISMESPDATVSRRSPTLLTGGASRTSHSQRPFPSGGIRPLGPRNVSAPLEARDRLMVNNRSAGYNSEPLLVPSNANTVSPPRSTLSQHDLTAGPSQQIRRLPSDSLGPTDPEDVEVRGKECAKRAWDEDEGFLAKEKIAEWLGGTYVLVHLSGMINTSSRPDLFV